MTTTGPTLPPLPTFADRLRAVLLFFVLIGMVIVFLPICAANKAKNWILNR